MEGVENTVVRANVNDCGSLGDLLLTEGAGRDFRLEPGLVAGIRNDVGRSLRDSRGRVIDRTQSIRTVGNAVVVVTHDRPDGVVLVVVTEVRCTTVLAVNTQHLSGQRGVRRGELVSVQAAPTTVRWQRPRRACQGRQVIVTRVHTRDSRTIRHGCLTVVNGWEVDEQPTRLLLVENISAEVGHRQDSQVAIAVITRTGATKHTARHDTVQSHLFLLTTPVRTVVHTRAGRAPGHVATGVTSWP